MYYRRARYVSHGAVLVLARHADSARPTDHVCCSLCVVATSALTARPGWARLAADTSASDQRQSRGQGKLIRFWAYHSGARGALPSGLGVECPLPLLLSDTR